MNLVKPIIILLVFILTTLTSCKDAQYLINNASKNKKFRYAEKWYNDKKWAQAIPLIDNLIPEYKGSDTSELLYYMLADAYFYSKEYMVAAYHYKNFKEMYPRSYKSEIASFRLAECFMNDIPRLELEQRATDKALQYYKNFITEYPESSMVEIAYEKINKINKIIENKARDAGDLYYKTKNYRAAAVTYKNLLNDYPNISNYEDILFRIGDSYMQFAKYSILTKQSERYETALNANQYFLSRFPKSKYAIEAKENVIESRTNLLLSAYENAKMFNKIEERPFYFNESIELFDEFQSEFRTIPTELRNYKEKCKVGILNTYYVLMENTKDSKLRSEYYKKLYDYYNDQKSKIRTNNKEYKNFIDIYNKAKKSILI